jgi:hypothetical protein
MTAQVLRTQDWEHRLGVLSAWRVWRHREGATGEDGLAYRAVLDGCAVTLRALCGVVGVKCQFKGFCNTAPSGDSQRMKELLNSCYMGSAHLLALPTEEERRCILEALYLANRAVAHPDDGYTDHKCGAKEMTASINVLIGWLLARKLEWPPLEQVQPEFLKLIG